LRAVQDIAVALLFGPRGHRNDVRARVRFRHGQAADMLAGDEFWQIARLLIIIPIAHNLVDAEVRVRPIGEADRARGTRHLLHRNAVVEIAEPQATVFLGRGDPVQAERTYLRPEVAREEVVAVDRRRPRRDLLLGESFRALADHLGALAEVEIEAARGVGNHGLRRQKLRRLRSMLGALGGEVRLSGTSPVFEMPSPDAFETT